MDVGGTQLIFASPQLSPSRSDALGELSGSDDGHEPTQLLYTQFLDQYDGHLDGAQKRRYLGLDMETQLVEDHNFVDFRKSGAVILPREDEVSKEAHFGHDDEGHSGSSFGKYGEVGSVLDRAFSGRISHWLPESTQRDRSIQGFAGRPSQTASSYRDRYLGETQILSDDEIGEPHVNSAKDHRNFAGIRGAAGGCTESLSTERDVPHFLRDFDPNRRNYVGQRTVGSWHEFVGQSDGCNEDDRGWESTVRGLHLLDSDASTEDVDNRNDTVFHAEVSTPGVAQVSENIPARLATHLSSSFCGQDLNKSPEPEMMMDDWGEDRVVNLEVRRIGEVGSNVGILEQLEQGPTSFGGKSGEGLNLSVIRSNPLPIRTAGSIRAACLHATAVRASSRSSFGQYHGATSQGSKSEVRKDDTQASSEMDIDVSQKVRGFVDLSRPIRERGPSSAVPVQSAMPRSEREGDFPRMSSKVLDAEKLLDSSAVYKKSGSKADTFREAGASSEEKSTSRAKKLFTGEENKMDSETMHKSEEVRNWASFERADRGKCAEVDRLQPGENHLSPARMSLERPTSFGSGLFSTGSEMSYLNLQSPGEDSQAKALNMVDKLVWLNATNLPQELLLEEDRGPTTGPLNAKSVLQSQLQVAEAKAGMNDPFGVFDWVDSQNDEAGEFFGGVSAKTNAGKGTSKLDGAAGSLTQCGVGSKKGGLVDAAVARNKLVSKVPEKEKVLKPMPSIDKPKALLSKNLSMAPDIRREKRVGQLRRDLSRPALTENCQQPGQTEPAQELEESCHDKSGNISVKRLGFYDKGLKKCGAIDNSSPLDQTESGPSPKASYQWLRKNPAGQNKLESVSSGSGLEAPHEEAMNASTRVQRALDGNGSSKEVAEPARSCSDRGDSAESEPTVAPKFVHDVEASAVAEPLEGNVNHVFQDIAIAANNEKGLELQDGGTGELPPQGMRANTIQPPDGILESETSIAKDADKARLTVMLQGDSDSNASFRSGDDCKMKEVTPVNSPNNEQHSGNSSDVVNVPQVRNFDPLQQNSYGDAQEIQVWSDRLGEFEQSHDRLHLIVDFNGLRKSESRHGSPQPSVNVLLTEKSTHRYAEALSPNQKSHVGPDTQIAGEAMEMLKSNGTILNGKGVIRERRSENGHATLELVPLENDIANDRGQNDGDNVQFVVQKGRVATRRSRSSSRQMAKIPGNRKPAIGLGNSMNQVRGRGRRVTWAGPLEQVPRQTNGVRRGRSSRLLTESREEDSEDSAADSSGQDEDEPEEEPEEEHKGEREATSKVNGTRRRKSKGFERSGFRGNGDLDKVKRKFNMSDAALARLLGTDEEEATSLKVRSLNRIQPEAEENEGLHPLSIRKVSKGLRSARIRSEEGSRRLRPVPIVDQGKLDAEEAVTVCDHYELGQGNTDGTTTLETHPSDNEVICGKRRTRSIADVSSPFLQQTTPGRSPLARGWHRRRVRRIAKSPVESREDVSDAELTDVPPILPSVPTMIVGFQAKGGLRSARKRREPEYEPVPAASGEIMSTESLKEPSPRGFKRRTRNETACVLLSHGLNEHTLKEQRKILAKLGGRIATSASECSHFVADKFVRTGNMLEAMASGRPVVTGEWLETCAEANRFVDEQDFILQDEKKEEEMGFSMTFTLAAAQQKPLMQGIRVFVTPGTSPGPESLARIVTAAGGQVVDEYFGPAPDGDKESDFCVVISSEEEFDDCCALLEQGAKVYTPELLLSGVTSYHLDFSNDQLFKSFTPRRRRGSATSRRTTV